MKSKELMADIKWDVLTSTILHKEEYLALCEEVEKDLEVLEILKKLFIGENHLLWLYEFPDKKENKIIDYYGNEMKISKEEMDKLTEWVENE